MELGERKMTPDEERYHYFSMNDLNKVPSVFFPHITILRISKVFGSIPTTIPYAIRIQDNFIDGIEVWKVKGVKF
jgi:hypothetical protein